MRFRREPSPIDRQPLTSRQFDILAYIRVFVERHGYAPTLKQIGAYLSVSSLATVHKHLTNLEMKGHIKRKWNRSRSIELVGERRCPFCGTQNSVAPSLSSMTDGRKVVESPETKADEPVASTTDPP